MSSRTTVLETGPLVASKSSPIPTPYLPPKPATSSTWNTRHLGWRVGSDATAAACATALVSPTITIIDRSIIERASSRTTISSSILNSLSYMLRRPHKFIFSKPLGLISVLYFGTYFTANSIDTLNSTFENKPAPSTTSGFSKFLATSSVNMSLCLYKDSQFARMFGSKSAVANVVPAASYALFALRDSLTIAASFNLPPVLAPMLSLGEGIEKHVSRASVAQFLIPAGMQLFSTPLHLLGLDLYNRPMGNGVDWKARAQKIGRDWAGSSVARMCRIIPAFGIGGVVNTRVRANLMRLRES